MLQNPKYVLAVASLDRSAAFYRDVLGFRICEIGDPGWRMFERDACVILAGECPDAPSLKEIGDHSYFAYVEADSIDAFYAEVTARGAELIKTIRDEPWGMREFGVRTVDGRRIMFGSPTRGV